MKLVVIIFAFIALTKANSMTADFQSCSLECTNDNGEFNPTSQHASKSRLNLIQGKSGPRGMKGDRGERGGKGESSVNSILHLKKQLVNLTDNLRNSARETNELRDDLRNSARETTELRTTVEILTDDLRNSARETTELRTTVEILTDDLRNSARETTELRDDLRNSARETNELRTTVEILTDDLRNSERETNELRITFATLTESLRPQNCSQIKEHYPASETGIYTIYENKLSSIGKQVGCDMSGQRIKVYETCGEILRSNPSSANGVYKIFVEPSTITNVYCDMSDEGIEIKRQTCDEILQWNPSATNGVYRVFVDPTSAPTDVYCNMAEGGWTVFQRRFDGSTDFRRNFEAYTNGFGDKSSEYWMGLENLYQMTKTGRYELYIKLLAYDGEERFAKYSDFSIGSGRGYILHIGSYSGDAGDSLTNSNGAKYSTFDNDQDGHGSVHCSRDNNLGAWWFRNCGHSNLNAHTYGYGERRGRKGMFWFHFKGWSTPMKETTMMVRKLN